MFSFCRAFLLSLSLSLTTVCCFHPIVNELKDYVQSNITFAEKLNLTFIEAGNGPNSSSPVTYNDMYIFFDSYLTIMMPPGNNSWVFTIYKFGCQTSTGSQLFNQTKSQEWMLRYMMEMKRFADSYNSTYIIPKWINYYQINMTQYIVPPNGYQSFNDFFTRKLNETMNVRPINSSNNDSIITSPCDGTIVDFWINNLTSNSNQTFNIKGITYNMSEILNFNNYYISLFEGGSLINIFLATYNYHRYHSSVSGHVIEIDDMDGYLLWHPLEVQNLQERKLYWPNANVRKALYIHNDNIGVIGQVYVGVAEISSVNINTQTGLRLKKGDETGYFKYGGSSIVLFFQPNVIQEVDIKINQTIQMGQAIAVANFKQDMSANKNEL